MFVTVVEQGLNIGASKIKCDLFLFGYGSIVNVIRVVAEVLLFIAWVQIKIECECEFEAFGNLRGECFIDRLQVHCYFNLLISFNDNLLIMHTKFNNAHKLLNIRFVLKISIS